MIWRKLFGRRAATSTDPFTIQTVDDATGVVRLVTEGLGAAGLRELEIVGVPRALEAEVRELLRLTALRVVEEKPERDGASIGGAFVDSAQTAIHVATLRVAAESIHPGARELLRVVDFSERVDAGFPYRLVATHLATIAPAQRSLRDRERLARASVELFPGHPAGGATQERFDRGENVENFVGWEALADVLFERGRINEARDALRAAAERCPAWASDFAKHIRAHVTTKDDPRMSFWIDYRDP